MKFPLFNYMTPELLVLSEPVKVGSVSFQTRVSSSVLTAPERRLDSTTSFEMGMKIINNTQQDYYFLRMRRNLIIEHEKYHRLHRFPQISRTDIYGYGGFYDYKSRSYILPSSDDAVLAEAGKSVNLAFQGAIAWRKPHQKTGRKKKNKEKTLIPETYVAGEESSYELGAYLILKDTHFLLQSSSKEAHRYKVACEYQMIEIMEYSKDTYQNSYFAPFIPSIDQIWVGVVHTPFIEFQIVDG